jgi:hypothetical protein
MAMKQEWYWLAAGVMALGLNGVYHDGGAEWAHRLVNRSAAVVALASSDSERFLASAQILSAREQTALCRMATEMARLQTKMARTETGFAHFDAMTAQQEAGVARLETNRAQFEAGRARMEAQVARLDFASAGLSPELGVAFAPKRIKLPVICPRVRVNIPRTFVRVPAPTVQVETLSAGPI